MTNKNILYDQSHRKSLTTDSDSNFSNFVFLKRRVSHKKIDVINFDVDSTGDSAENIENSSRFNIEHHFFLFNMSLFYL